MVIRVYVAFPPQAHVHEQRPSGHTSMLDVVLKAKHTHTTEVGSPMGHKELMGMRDM